MPRSVELWTGRDDNARAPKRVRDRIFDRERGCCHLCEQPINPGERWDLDHFVALINGGENSELNLKPAHVRCHKEKTARDVAEKAKIAAIRQRHRGIVDAPKLKGAPFPKTGKSARREKHAAEVKQLAPRRLFGFWQPGELGSGRSLEREGD